MDENKFTPTAEEALQLAQEAAGELGHGYMGTEHLLLGLMREDEGLAHTVLTEAGLTDDLLTEMIRKADGGCHSWRLCLYWHRASAGWYSS